MHEHTQLIEMSVGQILRLRHHRFGSSLQHSQWIGVGSCMYNTSYATSVIIVNYTYSVHLIDAPKTSAKSHQPYHFPHFPRPLDTLPDVPVLRRKIAAAVRAIPGEWKLIARAAGKPRKTLAEMDGSACFDIAIFAHHIIIQHMINYLSG